MVKMDIFLSGVKRLSHIVGRVRVRLWTIRGILHSLSTKSRVKHSMVG